MAATVTAPSKLSSEPLQSLFNGIVDGNRVLTPIDRTAYASDAEILSPFHFSHEHGIPLTFLFGMTRSTSEVCCSFLYLVEKVSR
jgi:hypothetical protein